MYIIKYSAALCQYIILKMLLFSYVRPVVMNVDSVSETLVYLKRVTQLSPREDLESPSVFYPQTRSPTVLLFRSSTSVYA
jgi:hypothetical protein